MTLKDNLRGVMMNKKHIILIIIIIAAIAAIGGYFFFNGSTDSISDSSIEQKTILLSKSAYMNVPDTKNVSDKVNKKGVHYYKNKNIDLNITSCSNLSDSSSEKELKTLKDSVARGAKKSTEDGLVVYEKNGTFSIFVKNTQYNDILLIQSSDKNLLLQCSKSVEFHDPAQKIKINDTGGSDSGKVINVVEKTEKAVSTSTPSGGSSSSKISSSASSWGYDWSSGSSKSGSSGKSSGAGGSASSSSRFDFT